MQEWDAPWLASRERRSGNIRRAEWEWRFPFIQMSLAGFADGGYRQQLEQAGWKVQTGERPGYLFIEARASLDSRAIVHIAIAPSKREDADCLLSILEVTPGPAQS